jgi:hypothetical protein
MAKKTIVFVILALVVAAVSIFELLVSLGEGDNTRVVIKALIAGACIFYVVKAIRTQKGNSTQHKEW